jgi:hypothetical protein
MYYTKLFFGLRWLVVLLCLAGGGLFAQPTLKWEPDLSYSWKQGQHWSFNTRLMALHHLHTLRQEVPYEWERIDLRAFATYKFFGGYRLTGGYMFRWVSPLEQPYGYEHRLSQQLAFVFYWRGKRLANRMQTEQRFRTQGFQHRYRYRISYDLPLQGEQLDDREWYLVMSQEVVLAADNDFRGENRLYLGAGWFRDRQHKIETGLQYRLGELGGPELHHVIHLITGFYFNR